MNKDYVLKKMITFHCKRGHPSCDRCMELFIEGPKYCILEIPTDTGMVSRPVTVINKGGTEIYLEFEFYQCFKTKEEAIEASESLNIIFTDIE